MVWTPRGFFISSLSHSEIALLNDFLLPVYSQINKAVLGSAGVLKFDKKSNLALLRPLRALGTAVALHNIQEDNL